ncbi:DUF6153 family protein [Kitasatospora sp. NPDC096147]|uniref:DUF6153 family protein n=1 Tax=Kitasatospora sp. NPDC096147 TaxID=3364093 RepID=UPI00380DB851
MHPEYRHRPAPQRVLAVLVVLLGVLGMHGLGAVPAPAQPAAVVAAAMTGEHQGHGEDGGGGHDLHAGPMCLAGAVAAPYLPGAPGPAPLGWPGRPERAAGESAPEWPEGGRAPPDPAELQVLRR